MKLVLLFAIALLSATQALASVPVDPTQLAAWQAFFDATGGPSWTKCKNKRDTPCTCTGAANAQVKCSVSGATQFITSVLLKNVNLAGPNVPVDSINTMIGQSADFTSIDLTGNTKLKNTNGGCLNIPNCAGKTCKFDFKVCPATLAPTAPTTTPPTSAPTISSTAAWRNFFDNTGGSSWTKCSSTRTAPCDCQRNQPVTAPIRVVCSGTTIVRVSLVANNLKAAEFPVDDVTALILAGATNITLTGNDELDPTASCFAVPACANSGVTCEFSKPVCGLPTEAPATTPASPTASPIAGVSGQPTASPSTSSPITTAPTTPVPATTSPSTKGTSAPTTASPSTGGTSSPTTPTVESASPSSAPSSSGATSAPTPGGETTPSPTEPVVVTASPTSEATMASGMMSGFAACIVASIMLMF